MNLSSSKVLTFLFIIVALVQILGFSPLGTAQRGYPEASFTYTPLQPKVDETVTFNASESRPNGGTLQNYVWDFGDGNGVAEADPIASHAYSAQGNYSVTLIVVDSEGLWDAQAQSIRVYPASPSTFGYPKASFSYSPIEPLQSEAVTFNASSSSDSDGSIVKYTWRFGDSTPDLVETDAVTTHAYSSAATYSVTLTVTDDDGLTDSVSHSLKVLPPGAPRAEFVYSPEDPIVNQLVTFNASLSNPNGGVITSYFWDFGDDTNATGVPVVTHNYTSFGYYQVTLKVTDSEGLSDTASTVVKVNIRDIAIVSVTPSATEVNLGQVVGVTVIARNEGTKTETFNVTLYAEDSLLDSQIIKNLPPSIQITLRFNWNTTGATVNSYYSIRAEAPPLQGEKDQADNNAIGGTVKVTISSASQPFDYRSALVYGLPIAFGVVFFAVMGALWKKRESHLMIAGFEYLNEITNGGIPDSSSVMIIGGAASGKSILCQELVHTYLQSGKACIYVTYDMFPDEVRKNMQSFQWDASNEEKEQALTFIDCYSSIAAEKSIEKFSVDQPFVLSDLGIAVSAAMGEVKDKSPRVFIDSTTPLFMRLDPSQVMEFLQDRGIKVKHANGIFFFTVGEGTVPPDLMGRLEEIVDSVIELNVSREKEKVVRKLRIKKMRGRECSSTWWPIDIEPGKGVTFFLSKKLLKREKKREESP